MKYVTDYTGFSGNVEEQSGNYLALKVSNIPEGAVVKYQKMDGSSEPVTLDEDLNIVLRISDKETVRRFSVEADGVVSYKDYDLSALVLTPAPEEPEDDSEEVVG